MQKDTRGLGFVERNTTSLSQRIIFRSFGTKTKINLSVIHGFRRKDDSVLRLNFVTEGSEVDLSWSLAICKQERRDSPSD